VRVEAVAAGREVLLEAGVTLLEVPYPCAFWKEATKACTESVTAQLAVARHCLSLSGSGLILPQWHSRISTFSARSPAQMSALSAGQFREDVAETSFELGEAHYACPLTSARSCSSTQL
jgi:hypothetical protein